MNERDRRRLARALRRKRRKYYESEPKEQPMRGECAVCGKPVPGHLPPRKDPNTPKFCDVHDKEDLPDVPKASEEYDPERYTDVIPDN